MNKIYSVVGPDVFMDEKGVLFKKASDDVFTPIANKYVNAENRYVKNQLEKKGRRLK